jgi:hypothetical protein
VLLRLEIFLHQDCVAKDTITPPKPEPTLMMLLARELIVNTRKDYYPAIAAIWNVMVGYWERDIGAGCFDAGSSGRNHNWVGFALLIGHADCSTLYVLTRELLQCADVSPDVLYRERLASISSCAEQHFQDKTVGKKSMVTTCVGTRS